MAYNKYVSQSEAIASYDWKDLASGFGYNTFYPAIGETSTTAQYYLATTTVAGSHGTLKLTSTGDYNFDIEFRSPQLIKGKVIIKSHQTAGSGSANIQTVFTIYKVNADATTTSLGTVTQPTVNVGASGRNYQLVSYIEVAETSFTPDESLRITISPTITSPAFIDIDPSGSISYTETDTGRTVNSQCYVAIPFATDL